MYIWEIFIFCALFSAKLSLCEPIDCLYGVQDYENKKWEFDPYMIFAVNNSEGMPEQFRAKPGLKSGNGIIYFNGDLIDYVFDPMTSLFKLTDAFADETENYIYIKYYTHLGSHEDEQRVYILPIVTEDSNNVQELKVTSNFSWVEAYYEIKIQDIIAGNVYALDIHADNFQPGDYLFIDTINVVQGVKITDISQFASHCPGNIEGPVPTTTTTGRPDLPQPAVLECIDDSVYFDYYKWNSSPRYNYAMTSFDLPDIFQGKLIGRGIFFFDGLGDVPIQAIVKPASHLNSTSPTFLYIKYYLHSASGSGAGGGGKPQAHLKPVMSSNGDYYKILETSSDFMWREELFEIDTEIALRIGVTLEFLVFSQSDFLLVDEIILTQGAAIQNSQEIKSLCQPALNTHQNVFSD